MLTDLESPSRIDDRLVGLSRAERTTRLFVEFMVCTDDDRSEWLVQLVIEANMELADTLARRYYGHGERAEDLRQTAYLGLNKAARRFDPARGNDFLAFAVPTILGELRRHFRDGCWMVRPPRRVQDLQARMMAAMDTFVQDHGRKPDPWELAEELSVQVDDVVEALSADGCFTPSSLDRPVEEGASTSLSDLLGAEEPSFDRVDSHLLLVPLVRNLPPRDHLIIELRFFRDWTQAQIAREIGVTQMQVSRLLARILRQLREQLDAPSGPAA